MNSTRTISFDCIKEMTAPELLAIAANTPINIKLPNGQIINLDLQYSQNSIVEVPRYQRTAMISDIHGHWQGLKLVLADIEKQHVDHIICLGDVVEGGDEDEQVVEYLKEQQITTILGNHDQENDCNFKPEYQQWLNYLPEFIVENDVILTHISPRLKRQQITNSIEAWNVFDECEFRLCFIGHIHFPAMFGKKHASFGDSCNYAVDEGEYQLEESDRYIISFGAVGYPRGGGKYLRYGIFDAPRNVVEFIRLEGPLLPYGLCRLDKS